MFLGLVLVTVIKYLFVKKNLLEEFFADMKQRDKDTFRSLPFILLGYGTSMAFYSHYSTSHTLEEYSFSFRFFMESVYLWL